MSLSSNERNRDKQQSAGRHGENFWTEEKNNFGVKMMTKMGWAQGKGLGKSESGQPKFLRAQKKQDSLGIGAKKGSDDTWCAAQGLYNEQLKRLAALNHAPENDGAPTDDSTSTKDDSQPSTAAAEVSTQASVDNFLARRQLYGKFKRAKDTANYSQSAMSEIFGRKDTTPLTPSNTRSSTITDPSTTDGKDAADGLSLIPTTTSSLSMKDYFANKLKSSDKKVNKFQVAGGQGFTQDFQADYYSQMMDMSIKGKTGLGFGGGGNSNGAASRGGLGMTARSKTIEMDTSHTAPSHSNGLTNGHTATSATNGLGSMLLGGMTGSSNAINGMQAAASRGGEEEEYAPRQKREKGGSAVPPPSIANDTVDTAAGAISTTEAATESEKKKSKKDKKKSKKDKLSKDGSALTSAVVAEATAVATDAAPAASKKTEEVQIQQKGLDE
jgi:hypothetical protein